MTNILITLLISVPIYVIAIDSNPDDLLYLINPNNIGNIKFYVITILFVVLLNFTLQIMTQKLFGKVKWNMKEIICIATVVEITIFWSLYSHLHDKTLAFIILIVLITVTIVLLAINNKTVKHKKMLNLGIIITTLLILITSLCLFFDQQYHYVIVFVGIICGLLLLTNNNDWQLYRQSILDKIEYLLVFLVCLLGFHVIGVYTIFGSGSGFDIFFNLHHSSAVVDSIFNVYYNVPYGYDGLTEQYGHYSLFYYPMLKIIGLNSLFINISFGLLTALMLLFSYYFIKQTVNNRAIRIIFITICMLAFILYCDRNVYWQITPIRLIFPSSILAYSAYLTKNDKVNKMSIAFGCIICLFAVLWNTESGLVSTVGWIVYLIAYSIQEKEINMMMIAKTIIQSVFLLVISLIFVIVVVNIFNILVTGFSFNNIVGISGTFGWLTNRQYIDGLETPIQWNSESLFIVFSLLSLLIYSISRSKLFKGNSEFDKNKMIPLWATLSTLGLLLMTYCINRTVADLYIIRLSFFVTLTIIIEQAIINLKTVKWNGIAIVTPIAILIVCSSVLGVYAFNEIGGGINDLQQREQNGLYDLNEYNEFVRAIEEKVDKDTFGSGYGVSELWMDLKWTNKTVYFYPEFEKNYGNEQSIFICMSHAHLIPPEYNCVQIFEYRGMTYGYYVHE